MITFSNSKVNDIVYEYTIDHLDSSSKSVPSTGPRSGRRQRRHLLLTLLRYVRKR